MKKLKIVMLTLLVATSLKDTLVAGFPRELDQHFTHVIRFDFSKYSSVQFIRRLGRLEKAYTHWFFEKAQLGKLLNVPQYLSHNFLYQVPYSMRNLVRILITLPKSLTALQSSNDANDAVANNCLKVRDILWEYHVSSYFCLPCREDLLRHKNWHNLSSALQDLVKELFDRNNFGCKEYVHRYQIPNEQLLGITQNLVTVYSSSCPLIDKLRRFKMEEKTKTVVLDDTIDDEIIVPTAFPFIEENNNSIEEQVSTLVANYSSGSFIGVFGLRADLIRTIYNHLEELG